METLSTITVKKAVEAADGFLRLGLPEEAWHELEFLPAALRRTRPVREASLRVYQALENWSAVAKIARRLATQFPDEIIWWVEWSEALERKGSFKEARRVLSRASARHPDNVQVNYHIARLCLAAGRREEAYSRPRKALSADPDLRVSVMSDHDIAPREDNDNKAA